MYLELTADTDPDPGTAGGGPVVVPAAAFLLDMDGTLVDSSAVVERAWTAWAIDHGLDPAQVMTVIHGRQSHESMAMLLPDRPHEQNLAEGQQMLEWETAQLDGIVAIPGAAELLAALAGRPHALVTSASRALAMARMTAAGLRMPAVAITAEDVRASKPHPEGFLTAAAALGFAPAHCVVLEDSAAGIAAARAAGMRVVAVGAGDGSTDAGWAVRDLRGIRVR